MWVLDVERIVRHHRRDEPKKPVDADSYRYLELHVKCRNEMRQHHLVACSILEHPYFERLDLEHPYRCRYRGKNLSLTASELEVWAFPTDESLLRSVSLQC